VVGQRSGALQPESSFPSALEVGHHGLRALDVTLVLVLGWFV
jgi:hypothetical protein